MAPMAAVFPSADSRADLASRGGDAAARCYQCATCSSVCQLAPKDGPFPRRQMLKAQWGLGDQLVNDPAVWLCHQCNDCTVRCPRDAKPGDVMQTVRSLMVEKLAVPAFMGRLVAKAGSTRPLRLGAPFLFWVLVLFSVVGEISKHRRFSECAAAASRRWGHFALLWGFVGAAVTSGFILLAIYVLQSEMPLPLLHPFTVLGNLLPVLLLVGGVIVMYNRLVGGNRTGSSTAFDNFFLSVVLLVILTGVLAEAGRFLFPPAMNAWIYIVHLTVVLCLFATFPYSKFAHMVYRMLAMVHERMTRPV